MFCCVDVNEDWGLGFEYCMYVFGNVFYNIVLIDCNILYISFNYEIVENVEWFG